jgi:hypothetical protein
MERNESACTAKATANGQSRGVRVTEDSPSPSPLPGAREKCLPPSAEDRPQCTSTPQGGSQVKEDKPSKPFPKEAERVINRLLYGTLKSQEPKAGVVKDRQGPEEVEWVEQWTYGTVQRLAEKLKIGVEK